MFGNCLPQRVVGVEHLRRAVSTALGCQSSENVGTLLSDIRFAFGWSNELDPMILLGLFQLGIFNVHWAAPGFLCHQDDFRV